MCVNFYKSSLIGVAVHQEVTSRFESLLNCTISHLTTEQCRTGSTRRRDLIKLTEGDKQDGWFEKNILRQMGNGKAVMFWHDMWIGEDTLKNKFQWLFDISEQNYMVVADMGR